MALGVARVAKVAGAATAIRGDGSSEGSKGCQGRGFSCAVGGFEYSCACGFIIGLGA